MKNKMIEQLRGGCIISCQALEHEPLHGSHIMAAMAAAAEEGGAVAIRANSPQDVRAIKDKCALPVIGLYKMHYSDSEVYITPTLREVEAIVNAGAEFVAVDCTKQARPGGQQLEELVAEIRQRFPGTLLVADVSTYEEGVDAMAMGADLVSTTMSGYTAYSLQQPGPDIELVRRLAALRQVPVLAEGRIWGTEECVSCFQAGAYAVVIGTAITRPQEIVKRYVGTIRDRLKPGATGKPLLQA